MSAGADLWLDVRLMVHRRSMSTATPTLHVCFDLFQVIRNAHLKMPTDRMKGGRS